MLRRVFMLTLATVAFLALPALAGDYKCTESTQTCLDHMAAKMREGGWVGVELDKNPAGDGYVVNRVVPESPAQAAGIRAGDVLFALNGVTISDKNEEALKAARAEWKPGQQVNYTIKRDGADKQIKLTLAPMPADMLAQIVGKHMLDHATAAEMTKN